MEIAGTSQIATAIQHLNSEERMERGGGVHQNLIKLGGDGVVVLSRCDVLL